MKKILIILLTLFSVSNSEAAESPQHIDTCGMTVMEYNNAKSEILVFYDAVVKNDTKTLKKRFHAPAFSKQATDLIIKSNPHNLFCNWQGIMLGDGVVWFSTTGSIIAVNDPAHPKQHR